MGNTAQVMARKFRERDERRGPQTWSLDSGQRVYVRRYGYGTVRFGGERQFCYVIEFDNGAVESVSVDNIKFVDADESGCGPLAALR